MRSEPKAVLITMYASKGDRIVRDPDLCNAELKDGCGECKKEIAILVNTVRCGAAQELLGSTAPYPSLRARLIQKVQDEQGLTQEAASWGVDTWREALTGSASKAPTPERPAPPSAPPQAAPSVPKNTHTSSAGKASKVKIPEFIQVLGMVILAFVGLVLGATFLSFLVTMILKMGDRHLTGDQITLVGVFLTRAAGLLGAIACFSSFKKHTVLSSVLGGALAGPIAYSLMMAGGNIPNGGETGAMVLGALVAAGLSKRSPKNVGVAGSSSSGK